MKDVPVSLSQLTTSELLNQLADNLERLGPNHFLSLCFVDNLGRERTLIVSLESDADGPATIQ